MLLDIWTILLFLAVFLTGLWYFRQPGNLPPGPIWLPVIGYPKFPAVKERLDWWDSLQRKYGDICLVWLGPTPVVFVFSHQLIREVLLDRSDEFSERSVLVPGLEDSVIRKGVINNENWRMMRKFTLANLRDFGAGPASLQGKIQLECEILSGEFVKHVGTEFQCDELLTKAVSNVICSVIFGKRYEYDDPVFQKAMENMDLLFKDGVVNMLVFRFPILIQIARKLGMRFTNGSMEGIVDFIRNEVSAHRAVFDPSHARDFIDLYLQAQAADDSEVKISDGNLLGIIFDLFAAGTETTSTTLRWLFVYMINFPEIQEKCRQEIHQAIGKERLPAMSDRSDLVYTEAMLLELQRLANIAPRTLSHCSRRPTQLGGYTIPAGFTIFPFLRSSHLDPDLWGDPEVFRPERWIKEGKLDAKNQAFMPFSLGRRQCLGEQVARMELFLFSVTFLQRFELRQGATMPSLKGVAGITLSPEPFGIRIMAAS